MRLAVVALALLLFGCEERRCARSHILHHPESTQLSIVWLSQGIPISEEVPARDEVVCDEWVVIDGGKKK